MLKQSIGIERTGLALGLVAALGMGSPPPANANEPTYGMAWVDGYVDEWDLTNDLFAHMYEAGDPSKDNMSDLYLRYDCNSKTLFALLLANAPPFWPDKVEGNAWIKIYDIQNSPMVDGNAGKDGTPPDFSWVPPDGIEDVTLVGYEASFTLQPGSYTDMEAHINVLGGRTSSTGRPDGIPLSLVCNDIIPDPSLTIEKTTNNKDADDPDCSNTIVAGEPVEWKFTVTNTGNIPLTNISVTDDVLGSICTISSLAVNASESCIAEGTAVAGLHENTAEAEAANYIDTGDPTDPDDDQEVPANDVNATDPSHYCSPEDPNQPVPAIDIEKATNGQDADVATGPVILAGQSVEWTYEVKNTGNVALENVQVEDDIIGAIICPQDTLAVNESMTCTANGTAQAGQYENHGEVTGDYTDDEGNTTTVDDKDPSHYFGADPKLDLEKLTQSQDADNPTGPYIAENDTVYWRYEVKNTGNVDLTDVVVTDNKLPNAAIDCGEGDNVINYLPVNETRTCSATGIAVSGQYENLGNAETTYTDDGGNTTPVNDNDPSHYFGAKPGIDIEKSTNGVDGDEAPGAFVIDGGQVTWTYEVTNTGNVPLENVEVIDSEVGFICLLPTLAVDEVKTCEATGTAVPGQYANNSCAEGDYTVLTGPDGTPETHTAEDCDPSHYYGFPPNQPSISVFGLDFDVLGDANEYINGEFSIRNESDEEVTVIGVTNIDMSLEYRVPKGNGWNYVDISDTCSFDPTVPFVIEGGPGTEGVVNFWCSADPNAIPDGASSVRVTACVDIFIGHRRNAKSFCYSSSGW